MTKYCVLILGCLWIIPNALSSTEQTFPSIANLTQTIVESGWKMLENHSDIKRDKSIQQKQSRMFQKIKHVIEILEQLQEPIYAISYPVFYDVALSAAETTRDETIFYDFLSFMQKVDMEYDRLKSYSAEGKTVHSSTMVDFAKKAVSHQDSSIKMRMEKIHELVSSTMVDFAKKAVSHQDSSIKMRMEKIHELVVPIYSWGSRGGILKLLTNNKDVFDAIIRISAQSPHQYLYNVFNKIAITEIKAYAVIQLSYAILELYGQGNFARESKLATAQFQKILRELTEETIKVTEKLSREYWKDDPAQYRKGENYLEISRLQIARICH
ncbi:protein of unknown function (DUF4803) [Popillia japonica]|uniref:Uncharacterized protein n=1 Tax=Popillia japonica TaxID=7064 RepID=A0AAW1MG01_POPJA